MIQTPSPGSRPSKGKEYSMLAFLGIILLSYLVLWVSAKVAGGNPSVNPIAFPFKFLGSLLTDKAFIPWHWVGSKSVNHEIFLIVVVAMLLVFVGIGIALYIAWEGGFPIPKMNLMQNKRPERTSHWATNRDIRGLKVKGPTPGRVILGYKGKSLVATEAMASILIFGPTQSGKSSGHCIPAAVEWDGPLVMTSTKRDLVDCTAGYRQRMGEIFIYDPTGTTGLERVTWSPLAGCEDREEALRRAADMAGALQSGKSGGSNDWEHWSKAARKLIGVSFYAAASLELGIDEVMSWINNMNEENQIDAAIERVEREGLGSPHDIKQARDALASVDKRPDKEKQTCYSTTQGLLDVFSEKKVAESSRTSEFNPVEFLKGKNTLYLCSPLEDQKRVASLFTGLIMSVINTAYKVAQASPKGRIDPELLLILDECANIAPLDDLPQIASQGLSQGIKLMTVFQDMGQMEERYGEQKARTIINNHRARVALRGIADVKTADYLSKLVGNEMVQDHTLGKGGGSYRYQEKQMLPPDVFRNMQEGMGLVIYGNIPAFLIEQRQWMYDDELMAKVKTNFVQAARFVGPEVAQSFYNNGNGKAGNVMDKLSGMIGKLRNR